MTLYYEIKESEVTDVWEERTPIKNWIQTRTHFRVETLRNSNTKQVNIALGQGKGLNQFNNNIIEFQLIKIIKK